MRVMKRKVFWIWGFEKEEQWLNKMSDEGLQLVDAGFCRYTFEEGSPSKYQYRLELLEQVPQHQQSKSYLQFLEGTGVECVGSYMRWVYLRKKTSDGPFNLFSDIDSRIAHVQRMFTLLICIWPLQIPIITLNLSNAIRGFTPSYIFVGLLGMLTIFLIFGSARIGMMLHRLKKERIMHE